jgi:hypothetical protein
MVEATGGDLVSLCRRIPVLGEVTDFGEEAGSGARGGVGAGDDVVHCVRDEDADVDFCTALAGTPFNARLAYRLLFVLVCVRARTDAHPMT